MSRSTGRLISHVLLILTLVQLAIGRRINATIYDTDLEHVSYAPSNDFCARWSSWPFWPICAVWVKPWESQYYYSQGKRLSMHRSPDHRLPSVTLTFRGSAIYLYGPPRNQIEAILPDYKVCLYENHQLAHEQLCYRVDVAEAYAFTEDSNAPVAIFAKGGLQYHEHRVVVSVSDPVDEAGKHHGIHFSHAVYTIERPTPWPAEEDHWRFREVVMHDTHPLLFYWPREPVCSWFFCWTLTGWQSKTYTSEDNSIVSWHELTSSQDEFEWDKWGVEATVMGGAAAIYGIPRAHIASTNYLSHICVQVDSGHCEMVDVQHAYLNAEHHEESVLLWRNDALDPSRRTKISARLAYPSQSGTVVFPFKAIHYYEKMEYSSPNPPVGRVEDVALAHDHGDITYHPGRRCVRHFAWWCTAWFDPWVWREAGPSESVLTYRSTVWSYLRTEDPAITVNFRGSGVYVYGAPKSLIKAPFASQHVCINDACHVVDVEQAYLNAPVGHIEYSSLHDYSADFNRSSQAESQNVTALSWLHPELDPVLIWSMTGLDDQADHTLRLALSPLHSEDNAEMSIAKVTYTRVIYDQGQWRPDTPVPPPDRSYEGPSYPPHAKKWEPLPLPSPVPAPEPPRQTVIQPSPVPYPSPSPKSPPANSFDAGLWALLMGATLFAFVALLLIVCCVAGQHEETRPILPDTPPPPYTYQPSPAPAPYMPPPRPYVPPPTPDIPRRKPHVPPPSPHVPPPRPTNGPSSSTPQLPTHESSKKAKHTSSAAPTKPPTPSSSRTAGAETSKSPRVEHRHEEPVHTCTNPWYGQPSSSKAALPKDQNNAGPCPGGNVAPSKPTYAEAYEAGRAASHNSEGTIKTPSSSGGCAVASSHTYAEAFAARRAASHSTQNMAKPPSASASATGAREAALPRQPQVAASPATRTTTEPSDRAISSRPTRDIPTYNSTTRSQPPPSPRPLVPNPVLWPALPPRNVTQNTTPVPPPVRADIQVARPPQVAQPVWPPDVPTGQPAATRRRERVASPPPQQTTAQMREQSVTPSAPPVPQNPQPRFQADLYAPDLAEWAASQGYRLDGLMNAATQHDRAPRPVRNQSHVAQTQASSSSGIVRNAQAPANPPQRPQPLNVDRNGPTISQRHGPSEANYGSTSTQAGNWRHNRQGQAPRGAHANVANGPNHRQNNGQGNSHNEEGTNGNPNSGGRGQSEGRGGHGGRGRRRRNGRGRGRGRAQN